MGNNNTRQQQQHAEAVVAAANAHFASLRDVPLGGDETQIVRRAVRCVCRDCRVALSSETSQTSRYGCSNADCVENTVACDLCAQCVASHISAHAHCVAQAAAVVPVLSGHRSAAETLWNRLSVYRERSLIGTVQSDGQQLTWLTVHAVAQRAVGIATHLRTHCSLVAGQHVGIYSPNCLEWIVVDLACILTGVVSVVVDAKVPRETATRLLANCNVVFRHRDKLLDQVPCPVIVMDAVEALAKEHHMDDIFNFSIVPREPNDVASILFTSGSTGEPKGVNLKDTFLRSHFGRAFGVVGVNVPTIILGYEPLALATGRMVLYDVIGCGGRCVLSATDRIDSVFWRELKRTRPTIFNGPPVLFQMLFKDYNMEVAAGGDADEILQRYKAMFGDRLQSLGSGGALVPQALLDFMKKICKNCHVSYGTSEAGHIATNGQLGSNVQVKVKPVDKVVQVPAHLADSETVVGELWVKTPTMTTGYTNSAFELDADGFLNTGDIVAFRQETRHVEVIERSKAMIKLSNSTWVSPTEIESVLGQGIVGVSNAFIWAENGADFVVGVVVCTDSPDAKDDDIFERCLQICIQKLSAAKIPRALIVERDPDLWETNFFTPSRKLKRQAVLEHYRARLKKAYESAQANLVSVPTPAPSESVNATSASAATTPSSSNKMTLLQLGLNSVQSVALARSLGQRQEFGAAFLNKSPTEIIDSLMGPKPSEQNKKRASEWRSVSAPNARILVTGATGFLGAYIVHELLCNTQAVVIAVVRGTGARDRLIQTLHFYDLAIDGFDHRLEVIEGDLAGLQNLPACDAIINSAARISSNAAVADLIPDNVLSVAKCCALNVPLIHISSLSVLAPTDRYETSEPVLNEMMSGYALSKAIAEEIVSRSQSPSVILRCGTIVGPKVNPRDWLGRFCFSCVAKQVSFSSSARAMLPIVSAVYIARVCTELLFRASPGVPRVLHAFASSELDLNELVRLLNVENVPFSKWREVMKADASTPVHDVLDAFFSGGGFPSYSKKFDETNCEKVLSSRGGFDFEIASAIDWLRRTSRAESEQKEVDL